jgi:hypothetical protein
MHNVTVYREPGRFAGWPANYGIWSWGDEIVVGFTLGWYRAGEEFHARDRSRPMVTMQARSLDGGESWTVTPHPARPPAGAGLSVDEHVEPGLQAGPALAGAAWGAPLPGDLQQRDFALMCGRTGLAAGAVSWLYTSADRGRTWSAPRLMPSFGQPGIAARTDYIVLGPSVCLLFLTAAKADGREGRVFCARSTDGLATFDFVSWIGAEPAGFAIMPASVRLPSGRVLVAVRCRGAGSESGRNWIDLYASDDHGASWVFVCRPVDSTGRGGNPPTLTLLRDGRLALAYGYRDAPAGIRCRCSSDGGASWGAAERVLRADAGDHDIGYPRTVQRADGRLVTVYYYDDSSDGERYIAATIWEP